MRSFTLPRDRRRSKKSTLSLVLMRSTILFGMAASPGPTGTRDCLEVESIRPVLAVLLAAALCRCACKFCQSLCCQLLRGVALIAQTCSTWQIHIVTCAKGRVCSARPLTLKPVCSANTLLLLGHFCSAQPFLLPGRICFATPPVPLGYVHSVSASPPSPTPIPCC